MISFHLLGIQYSKYSTDAAQQKHVFKPLKNENTKDVYRTCKLCYQKISASRGREVARKANPT